MHTTWPPLLCPTRQAVVQTGKQRDLGITDQVAMNNLLEYNGPNPSDPENPRILMLLDNTLRMHPLPVLQFPSGHVAFVQRLPWK